ncbi:MAG TPA: hypothetical protein P5064_06725 [Clostridia bacterium]|jgi:hypothetical protein|nr:hypothetical protein [Clostridiaceae bacterium]HOF26474.1 hypothetical protein [Clostridia bacterium]HOM34066.1 hypothetical protein [Clostridia bacterium]HOR89645.1 hypothetical protein [Clostridia bacterium]HOT71400.1 hypothetical protein [Clostridia bacterium]
MSQIQKDALICYIDEALPLIDTEIDQSMKIKKDLQELCRGFSKNYKFNTILVSIPILVLILLVITMMIISLNIVVGIDKLLGIPNDSISIVVDVLPIIATHVYLFLLLLRRIVKTSFVIEAQNYINKIEYIIRLLNENTERLNALKNRLNSNCDHREREQGFINYLKLLGYREGSYDVSQSLYQISTRHEEMKKKMEKSYYDIPIIICYFFALLSLLPASAHRTYMYFFNRNIIYDYDTYYTVFFIIVSFLLILANLIITNKEIKLSIWTFLISVVFLLVIIAVLILYVVFTQ